MRYQIAHHQGKSLGNQMYAATTLTLSAQKAYKNTLLTTPHRYSCETQQGLLNSSQRTAMVTSRAHCLSLSHNRELTPSISAQ